MKKKPQHAKEKDTLPNTLSELILVAVNDARKLDRKKYTPFSGVYHIRNSKKVCQICDAGAVIAGTLKGDHEEDIVPREFSSTIRNKLIALDQARLGYYCLALKNIDITPDIEAVRKIKLSPFSCYKNWEEFDKHLNHMENVAQQLKDLGY